MATDEKTNKAADTQAASDDDWGQPVSDMPDKHDFASGDLIGTLGSVAQRELDNEFAPGETKMVNLYTVQKDDGEKAAVWGSAVLDRTLPDHVGHYVRIQDAGKVDAGQGRQLRQFNVYCKTCAGQNQAPSAS